MPCFSSNLISLGLLKSFEEYIDDWNAGV
jgi:hypothetical protein